MRFAKYLQEEYVAGLDLGTKGFMFRAGYTEIFRNPSNKEIRYAIKDSKRIPDRLRFILDFNKKCIYVFRADIFHIDVSDYLKDENEIATEKKCFWGTAAMGRGNAKLQFDGSDEVGPFDPRGTNDKWTEKWFGRRLSDILKDWYE